MSTYRISEAPCPYRYNQKMRTVIGPSLISTVLHVKLRIPFNEAIPEDTLVAVSHIADLAYEAGRESVRQELREVLNIRKAD